MAYVITTQSIPLRNLFAFVAANLAERINRHSIYRRTLQELSQLSNRELADIGVARASIEDIAREHAYGK